MTNIYDCDLDKNQANYQPLTPLTFLERAATVFPDHIAVIHGNLRISYAEFYARCRRFASALALQGIGRGDTVSVMLANTPAMLEVHYAVPMCGAVLHSMNTRLDAKVIAFQLDHAECRLLVTDTAFSATIKEALELTSEKPLVVDYQDPVFPQAGELLGSRDYESMVASGDPSYSWLMPYDEWDAISVNYTSGTTGDPKGVVYHHRGACHCWPKAMPSRPLFPSMRCTSGHCPCSTAMAGAFPGPCLLLLAPMSVCVRCEQTRSGLRWQSIM